MATLSTCDADAARPALVLGDGDTWALARVAVPGCAEPLEAWCSQGALERRSERVLPACSVALVWNLDAPIHWRSGAGPLATVPALSIAGLGLDAFELRHPAHHRALGLRMPPELAVRLLGGAAGSLGRAPADLSALWPAAELDALAGALGLDAPSPPSPRVLVVRALAWLQARCARGPGVPRRIRLALEALRASHPVHEVAAALELSHAQLTRSFKDALGLTPRRYVQVARLTEACRRIAAGEALVEVAHGCGFADQSHMTRSFGALAGVTPAVFAATHGPAASSLQL